MKRALVFCLTLGTLISCTSVQKDVMYSGPAMAEDGELQGFESRLVDLRARVQNESSQDKNAAADLKALRGELAQLRERPSTDPLYRSRLLALSADAALLSGDRGSAAKFVDQARSAYKGDEFCAVVGSRLADTLPERETLLVQALSESDGQLRIKAELGFVLENQGRYREALGAFDASLVHLDESYARLYGPARERAYALKDAAAPLAEESSSYMTDKPITLLGLVVLTRSETDLLSWIDTNSSRSSLQVFKTLQTASWFGPVAIRPDATATRNSVALFLWRLLAQNNAKMLSRYTTRYSGRQSPVEDVPYGSPYFDAVLGTVEEGIMDLKDGKSFAGEEPVSGFDFYALLLKAKEWR